eukprot:TRINITY_DN734_c0_g1_i1.p1 TRINITY_DN734_c0_g1~~TRINITY_DN734_c0_g1_i1.p1  ORF type:complete len:630 (-),score=98.76 TRINITY_DN734_c0_g1_i1:33-1922(-)
MRGSFKEAREPSFASVLPKLNLERAGGSNTSRVSPRLATLIRLTEQVPKSVIPEFAQHSTPRDGPFSRKNVVQVSAHFPLRLHMEAIEKRTVSVTQLMYIFEYANRNCYSWGYEVSTLDFMRLNKWITLPTTRDLATSLSEHLPGAKEQVPAWFVSHWWGDFVGDFLKCIQHHVAVRGLFLNITGYWLHAYCSRYEDLESGNYTEFVKAMKASHYKVLLIVNSSSKGRRPATTLARAWCIFECSQSLDRVAPHFDVAVVNSGGQVEMITSGVTHSEANCSKYSPGQGIEAKIKREASFPMDIASVALGFDIRKLQSTLEKDRTYISQSLLRMSTSGTKQEEGEQSDIIRRMRSLFSLIFFNRAVASVPSDKQARKAHLNTLRDLATAIRSDTWRRALIMNVAGSPLQDPEIVDIVWQSFPMNLHELKLDLTHTGFVNSNLEKLTAFLPGTVSKLYVNLTGCPEIDDAGVRAFVLALPPQVKELELCLWKTAATPGLPELSKDGRVALAHWASSNRGGRAFILSERLKKAVKAAEEEKAAVERKGRRGQQQSSQAASGRKAPTMDLASAHAKRHALETMLKLPESALHRSVREKAEADLSALRAEITQQVHDQIQADLAAQKEYYVIPRR